MRKRLTALLQNEQISQVTVSTFHAFCLQVLREKGSVLGLPPDFELLSEIDAGALARQVHSETKKGGRSVARFLRELPDLKLSSLEEGKKRHPLHGLYEKYQLKLRSLGMLDLNDLEVETLRLLRNYPEIAAGIGKRFPKILVDEYQDTNRTQVEILKALVYPELNLPCDVQPLQPELLRRSRLSRVPCPVSVCAIGDPDQAIYGFRGADVENFHRFAGDFPGTKTVTLLVNYRSTQPILDAASSFMQKKQKLKAVLGIGELVQISDCRTEAEEAEMIVEQIEKLIGGTSYFSLDSGRASSQGQHENLGFGDIAVLFRLNSQGDAFEESFSRAGIPFVRSGEKPLIEVFPINVIWRFLQTISDPENAYYKEAYRQILKDSRLASTPPARSALATTPPSPLVARTNSFVRGSGKLLDLIHQAVTFHGLTACRRRRKPCVV
jgi:DNA helicase-2/ATP-dependent DNA helicase PcrA